VKIVPAVLERPSAPPAGAPQMRDALMIVGLCVVALLLLCAATAYLAVNKVLPALAPVRFWERMRVWSRFSLLAAQEVRSWR
jgi:hypothetical protein